MSVELEEDPEQGVVRVSDGDVVMTIGRPSEPYHDRLYDGDFVDFSVAVSADGLAANRLVSADVGPYRLPAFLRALADDWRGEMGDQTWVSIEHEVTIKAKRVLGYVNLVVTLRDSGTVDGWTAQATISFEGGRRCLASQPPSKTCSPAHSCRSGQVTFGRRPTCWRRAR